MQKLFRQQILNKIESYTQKLIEQHQPMVIGVTGSVGKTSTKLAIAHVLKSRYKVLVHEGNYNTEFGLPLSLFELETPSNSKDIKAWLALLKQMKRRLGEDYPYDVVVLEMGADRPGDIAHFMKYLKPDIGVVTAVAKVHIENYDSVEDIASEKWQLARGSKVCIYNHDDERLRSRGSALPNSIGYGLSKTDVWAELGQFEGHEGWSGALHLGGTASPLKFPVIAQQSVYALTAAAAVGLQANISTKDILVQIESWKMPNGRMNLLKGKNGTTIIDDTYNSSPYAAVASLDALYRFTGRKIAILGSMNELGNYEVAGHQLVGRHCGQLDMLVTIGVAANKHIVPAAMESGLDNSQIRECNTPYEAGDFVASILEPGDVVLAKGSQNGVFAEEAVKRFLADSQDVSMLVRQSEDWLNKKKEQFK